MSAYRFDPGTSLPQVTEMTDFNIWTFNARAFPGIDVLPVRLGDRVRMQEHATDPQVFIRSMAARGNAGGLATTSGAAAAVLDAVGFDLILVETVGTGQSEVEVAAMADTTVVLEAPEMGDEVQAIKAGLLEVADLIVVNKGDRPGAARTAAQLRAMLALGGNLPSRASDRDEQTRCPDQQEADFLKVTDNVAVVE